MFKYMKYEFKGTYKFMGLLILFVLGASTGIQLYANNIVKQFQSGFGAGVDSMGRIPNFLVVLLVLAIFGAFVTALFYIIGLFRKELYEDRGYLTFSLPLTGNQILGAKTLTALIWAAILGFSALFYNLGLGSILFGAKWLEGLKYVLNYTPINIIVTLSFSAVLSSVITLLLIYFSITLSRVSIKNKKIGGLWFIIFLIINSLVGYLTVKVSSIFPYYIDLSTLKIIAFKGMGNFEMYVMSMGTNSGLFIAGNNNILINIGSFIFSILVAVGTFLGTSYLMERKIDL